MIIVGSCGRAEPGTDGGATGPDPSSGGRSSAVRPSTDRATRDPGAVPSSVPSGDDVTVARVVDGDTIVVTGDVTVRLIGVDTPETRHPQLGVQCYGHEATAFTAELLPPGTPVRLVYDVERTDRYGRTLAYVYRLADGTFVNGELVRQGVAQVATVPPNVRHAEDFLRWQRAARERQAGLWQACAGGDGTPAPEGSACDPAYPSHCLPSPPPDLDCGDLDVRDVVVRPPDPHHLDGDGDGIGCAG